MKRQRSGKIINISPIAGRGLSQSSSTYATAKGGVIAFTRKLSFELGPYGMTCNAIAPSRMRDDLGAIPFLGKGALREMRRPHILRVPCLHLIFFKVLTTDIEQPYPGEI